MYTGDFKDGKKTGSGIFIHKDSKYEGEFVDGQFHGVGKYYNSKTKRTFEGTFQNNNFLKGRMLLEDGSYYEGQYKRDMRHGEGTIYYPNGNAYVGLFDQDQKHGAGCLWDLQNVAKVREEWVRGTRKSFVIARSTVEELTE